MTRVSQTIYNIGKSQSDMFCRNPPVYESSIIEFKTMRDTMLMVYNNLVVNKLLVRLEDLPPKEKNEIWENVKPIVNGKMDKEGCIEFSKVMYSINYYLEN